MTQQQQDSGQRDGDRPDTGKVALITGASRGIGYGIAEALVARGDRVCITDGARTRSRRPWSGWARTG